MSPREADKLPWVQSLLRARRPYIRELQAAPTPAIYAALRRLQEGPAAYDRIHAFVRFLLDERGERPTAALYEALVRANGHTHGSADGVRDVWRMLRTAGLDPTPGFLHGALWALAIHPDYLTRNAVLQAMRDRWIDPTPDGLQSLALGLLRDGQYERALDQLDVLSATDRGGIAVPPWLYDIFVFVLGQEGFLDEALRIVNHRLLRDDHAGNVSLNVWAFLLDACCRQGYYEGLCYVWRRAVRPGRLAPSDAAALDMLETAARHHDAALAAEVMHLLSARGSKLGMPHFEAMLDCYARAGAVDKALQALCIMDNAGIVPDAGSTRSIYACLRDQPPQASLDGAVAALLDLRTKYGRVPVAAFNVVLEAMLQRGGDKGEEAALDLYRHVRQLCPGGPDRGTFRLLFRGCDDVQHLNFLFREMRAFSLLPDMDMVDRVVYENATRGSLDQAVRHVLDLVNRPGGRRKKQQLQAQAEPEAKVMRARPWISRKTAAALARRCLEEEDARIWEIAEASRARGRPMDTMLRGMRPGTAQETQTAYGVPRAIGLAEEEDGPDL